MEHGICRVLIFRQTIHGNILVKNGLNIINGAFACLDKDKTSMSIFVTGYTRSTLCQHEFINNHPCIFNGNCDWLLHLFGGFKHFYCTSYMG